MYACVDKNRMDVRICTVILSYCVFVRVYACAEASASMNAIFFLCCCLGVLFPSSLLSSDPRSVTDSAALESENFFPHKSTVYGRLCKAVTVSLCFLLELENPCASSYQRQ